MKLLPFLFAVAFTINNAKAQTEKGNVMLGATGGATSAAGGGQGYSALAVSPMVGKFVVKDLVVGMQLPLSVHLQSKRSELSLKGYSIGVSPFVRYYLPACNSTTKGRFFGELSSGVAITTATLSLGSMQQLGVWTMATGMGYNYFFNKNIALETKLGVQRNSGLGNSIAWPSTTIQPHLSVGIQFWLR